MRLLAGGLRLGCSVIDTVPVIGLTATTEGKLEVCGLSQCTRANANARYLRLLVAWVRAVDKAKQLVN